ncbi:DUF2516 family protein [Zhihengliuella sp.]|uniref:DUF2516 family protein n=1 Tax=Zhihengliuella sp. TaxID=1954483 RepID=UPI002811F028|nr:DUF2516 family protein [Zhihengliuella sp.]
MGLAYAIEHYLFLALGVVALVLAVWAFLDAVRRPAANFAREGKRTKGFWLALTAGSTLFCLLSVYGGSAGLLQLIAACVAAVYLADVRPAVSGRGGYSY